MHPSASNSDSALLGEMPPIYAKQQYRQPDRRQISLRWLGSSVLVGITSLFLMGGALYAALDGRQQLTVPGGLYEKSENAGSETVLAKGPKPGLSLDVVPATSNVMMVSTVHKDGDNDVISVRPFMHIAAPLAIAPKQQISYPKFNALAIFSESGKAELTAKSSDSIYGASVESQVKIKTIDFPYGDQSIAKEPKQNFAEIEALVRNSIGGLQTGDTLISPVAYFDGSRFSLQPQPVFPTHSGISIVAENVSVLEKFNPHTHVGKDYTDREVPVRAEAGLSEILQTEGLEPEETERIEEVVSANLGSTILRPRDRLLMDYEVNRLGPDEEVLRVAKMSIMRGTTHLVSIARNDEDRFVYAKPPVLNTPEQSLGNVRKVVSRTSLPSAYDGIYRAALSEGLTGDLADILIKIFAFDVDFRSRIEPNDELSLFVSLEEGADHPTAESEILHASITLNNVKRRYYRFRDEETGRVDYYDETGKSAKKFLLRQPVPNGKFRSPFGWRIHPVHRYRKMHWGVDWAAPHGTKILAAGNGVVEKAGWAGGNGRRIVLRHANGYETSYSHLRAYAKGIRAGARVRQGQLIGYVGSSGLSTGPHLHYEVRVNNKRVNPMRIRLPQGKVLRGQELAKFEAERDRIDALLNQRSRTRLAALN